MVSISECPTGEVLHGPHTWYQGFFIKHGCSGWRQKDIDMMVILKAGSNGTLTIEQTREYLEKWKGK